MYFFHEYKKIINSIFLRMAHDMLNIFYIYL